MRHFSSRLVIALWVSTLVVPSIGDNPSARAQESVEPQKPASGQPKIANAKLGDHFIASNAIMVAQVNPANVVSHESLVLMPWEILEAASLDNVGVSIKTCDSIRIVTTVPGPSGPMAAVIVKFNQPTAIADLNPQLVHADRPTKVDGLDCFPINGPPGVVMHQADPQTIVIASSNFLEMVMDAANGGESGQLAKLASAVDHPGYLTLVFAIEPVRPMVNGMLQMFANQLPPQLAQFTELPNLLDAMMIRVDMDQAEDDVEVVFLATDNAAAEKISLMMDDAIAMGRQVALSQVNQEVQGDGPVPNATHDYVDRIADRFTKLVKPKREGRRLIFSAPLVDTLTIPGMLLGTMAPVINANQRAVRDAGRDVHLAGDADQNLKVIGLAMHNHHSAFRKLPDPINRDADGKPLLSWRVHILPFIEEQPLYEEFRLDEPWDSQHNIKLLSKMPAVFQNTSIPTDEGETVFQLPMGEGTMFNEERSTRFRDILDGLSNTAMVVQTDADSAVPWSKPVDLSIDPDDPAADIGFVDGQTVVLIGDGSTKLVPETSTAEFWNALLSRAGRD